MSKFQITYKDGSVRCAESVNNELSITWDNVLKIEAIDETTRRNDIKQANAEFTGLGKLYWPKATFIMFVNRTLEKHGFMPIPPEQPFCHTDDGALRCFPVGRNTYLTVTWYRMESGRFELVAYVS